MDIFFSLVVKISFVSWNKTDIVVERSTKNKIGNYILKKLNKNVAVRTKTLDIMKSYERKTTTPIPSSTIVVQLNLHRFYFHRYH